MRFEDTPLLWTIDDVYTAHKCASMVEQIERWAPRIATNNPMYRDQDRVIRDDVEFASDLFERLRSNLPETMGGLRLVGLNERLRFYRYRSGQRFEPHTDHWYQPSDTRISLLTVLIYFNDDFEGGATRFMEHVEELVVPRPGLAAIFQRKIRHEGCEVDGGRKYALRTDAMYEAASPIRRLLT